MNQRLRETERGKVGHASAASTSTHPPRTIRFQIWWLVLLVPALLGSGPQQAFAQALSAPNFTVSTPQNTQTTIDFSSFNAGNPNAVAVGVALNGGPSRGTAFVSESGIAVTYVPTPGFAGTDSFTYTLNCDCSLTAASGTVTVIVDSTTVDSSIYGVVGALQQTTLLSAFAQIDNFDRHLEDLHDVLRHLKQLGISINGQSSPASSVRFASIASMFTPASRQFASDAPRARLGPQTAQADASDAVPIELPDRIGLFVNGNLSLRQITGRNGFPDASPRTTAISGGIDYRLNAGTIVGLGAGYTTNTTDIGGGSKSTSNGFNLTAYGTTRPIDPVYIDAQLSFHHISFDTLRDVGGAAFLRGNPDGNVFSGSLTGGYEFDAGPYTFGPYLRIDGAHGAIDAFTESGPSAFAMSVSGQTVDSAHTVLGARGDRAISTNYGIVSPHLRAEYLHEFVGGSSANVGFASGAASGFVISGYPISHNYFMLGGGVSFLTVSALSFFIDYDALVGYTDQTSHSITAGASIRF
jgi:outer membrane autotransporter protein